jgi:hypothetical protein
MQLQNEEIQRREKQLAHQIKMSEINQAQENFFKGVQLLPTLSDDVAPALVKTFIAPSIAKLNEHGVTGYSPEETQSFLDQLQQNPSAAKAVAKDINALIKNPSYQGQDGKINYPSLIKDMKVVFSTHAAKLSDSQKKGIESLITDTAVEGYSKTQNEDEKKYLGAQMNATQQKAFGIGDEAKISDFAVFYRGYKEKNPNALEAEISDAWGKEQAKRAAQKVSVTVNARGGDLSPDAIKQEGIKYALTGKMPAMGMGNPVLRSKIMNAAAEYYKENGIDPMSIPALQADYTASNAALTKATKDFTAIKGFEEGMIKNMDYAVSLSKGFGNTKYPLANTLINALKTQTGDPKIVEFSNAIYAAAMEYEKIRTAGTGITSAELSVNAQAKAEKLINTSQNHAQLLGAQKAMITDAKNISNARNKQLQVLRNSIKTQSPAFGEGGKEQDPLGIR